jgi:PIN domain nuclease of toxin-antitoxin system
MAAGHSGKLRETALRLLLDTNVLIWWMAQESAQGGDTGRLIADPDNEVLLSVVCLWEMAIKNRVGKVDVAIDRLIGIAEAEGFTRIGIEDTHLRALVALPFHHRDPFDHLLIAQAIAEDAAFVTRDRAAARYPITVVAAG